MESTHLTRDDARRIAGAIDDSGVFIGTAEWFESSGVTEDEYRAFMDYAMERAAQMDWLDQHRAEGYQILQTVADLKQIQVTDKGTKLVFELSASRAYDIHRLSALVGQTLDVEVYPEQMPLPIAEEAHEPLHETA